MIRLFRDDTGEEIFFDGEMDFTLYNPLFNDIVSHSFTVKVLNTRYNRHIFDYIHLPEIRDNNIEIKVTAIINNILPLKGAIIITNATQDYLDFHFKGENNFWSWAKEIYINTLDLDANPIYCEIYNAIIFENAPFIAEEPLWINKRDIINRTILPYDETVEIPFYLMNDLLTSILNYYGLTIVRNDIAQDDDLSQLAIFNETSNSEFYLSKTKPGESEIEWSCRLDVDYDNDEFLLSAHAGSGEHNLQTGDYVDIARIIPPDRYEDYDANKPFYHVKSEIEVIDSENLKLTSVKPSDFENYDTTWTTTVIHKMYVLRSLDPGVNIINHLPEITVNDFIKKCEILAGFKIFISESQNSARLLLINNTIDDNETIDITDIAGVKISYQKYLKKGFKLSFDGFDDDFSKERISEILPYYNEKSEVTSIDDLPLTGNEYNDIRKVTILGSYYRWNEYDFNLLSKWEFLTDDYNEYIEDEGEYEYKIDIAPLIDFRMGYSNDHTTYYYWRSRIDKKINFITFNHISENELRCFFFRGFAPSYYRDYCMSGRKLYYLDGNYSYLGNLELKFQGEYGLLNKLYRKWLDFFVYNYGEEKRMINWDLHILNDFKWWKKHSINGMNYYIHSIRFKSSAKKTTIGQSILVPAIH